METKQVQPIIIRTTIIAIAEMLIQHFRGLAPVMLDTVKKSEIIKKIGCTFATLYVARVHDDSTMIKKHRVTGEINPFLNGRTAVEKYTLQVLLNAIFQNALINRGSDYKAEDKRRNGIENVDDSRVICSKIVKGEKRYYLNYIVLDYLTPYTLVDNDGQEIDRDWFDGFLKTPKVQKEANREKTAELHGLDLEVDPQIRQMKLSNIENICVLNYHYRPTEATIVSVAQPTMQTT